ncbi:NfeD family protein [Candidatus Tokpelaia sp.]|uniref:NfeD family protein n=1 Tax=Candidatus Tokpelaia sp. TaxID=2233777 RepID=UPI0012384139|nr:NfeD family protein [Candidatus Tokpelaia sp.]KAA6405122.1 NfeD family protein [Candidatus Tokpelaia sp.]
MVEWLRETNLSLWFIFGLALLCAELALPGIFLVWFGAGALATALIVAVFLPFLAWQWQIIIFLLCSSAAVLLSRRYFSKKRGSDALFLNNRIAELIGQSFILETAISGNKGSLHIDDSLWQIRGEDMPKGSRVRITGYRAGALEVKAASPPGEKQ